MKTSFWTCFTKKAKAKIRIKPDFFTEIPLKVEKLRELEKRAKELGFEVRILIENVSSNLCEIINKLNLGKKALVISGKGNNGADVLSCARKLASRGYSAAIAVLEEEGLGKETLFQKDILKRIKLPLYSIKEDNVYELKNLFKNCDFILEGILGIGIKGEVKPFLKEVISLINKSGKIVVSCDIPSGLCPREGKVLGAAIKADYTVTFAAPKEGFFLNQGKDYCGKVFTADIGISREILENI